MSGGRGTGTGAATATATAGPGGYARAIAHASPQGQSQSQCISREFECNQIAQGCGGGCGQQQVNISIFNGGSCECRGRYAYGPPLPAVVLGVGRGGGCCFR